MVSGTHRPKPVKLAPVLTHNTDPRVYETTFNVSVPQNFEVLKPKMWVCFKIKILQNVIVSEPDERTYLYE